MRTLEAWTFTEFSGGVCINWSDPNVGFGQIYVESVDGKLHFSAEGMSKEFIKQVLCQLVDESNAS